MSWGLCCFARLRRAALLLRSAVITPQTHSMNDAVAIMTGAMTVDEADQAFGPVRELQGVAGD